MQAEATPRRWWEFLPEHPARERIFRWAMYFAALVVVLSTIEGLLLHVSDGEARMVWSASWGLLLQTLPGLLQVVGIMQFYRFVAHPLPRTPWLVRHASWLLVVYAALHLCQTVWIVNHMYHLLYGDPTVTNRNGWLFVPGVIATRLLTALVCIGISQALVYLVPWIEAANRTDSAADVTT